MGGGRAADSSGSTGEARGADGMDLGTVAGLVAELSELTSLILDTDSMDRVVWEAAMLAVRAIDEVDACGVTVVRGGEPSSILPATAPYGKLEDFQYEHDAGPIFAAMSDRRSITITIADAADQWPSYASVARELGVSCTLVVPLTVGEEVLGALSLYATADDCDLTVARNLGELVADLAGTALTCMARHAEKIKLTEELRTALTSRAVIEQAKGALMASRGIDADAAFALLRHTSQNNNIKLRTVATVVAETQGGATRPD